MKDPRKVIKVLLISEKSLAVREKNNGYVFEVANNANKIDIKQAIEKLYSVKVSKVTTQNNPSKQRRVGRHHPGYTNEWKKAVVTLAKDQKITEFETI
ncbi:MAG: 50S ribosomal protein L23 [Candidatus Zixiibacteriota bacterium]